MAVWNSQQYLKFDRADFENDIFRGVVESYPVQKNVEVIFRFPRLFFVAVK